MGVGLLTGALAFLSFSIDVVDLFDKTACKHVASSVVIGMALLQLPNLCLKLLPFAVLLGGVFSFVRLSRSQELVALRAAGLSAWNILAPPIAASVALGVLAAVAFTPFSSFLLQRFAGLEARYIHDQPSQLAVSKNGLWLRQAGTAGQSVIHALRVAEQGVLLQDVIVFLYGKNDVFAGRIDAQSADLHVGTWWLRDAWVSGPEGHPAYRSEYQLATTLTPSRIQESFASPDTMSFWDLPGFIQNARQAGFSANRYELYFDSLLMLPALFAAMVFMAASFSFRLTRLGGLGRVVLYSALSGFGIYFFGDVVHALGISGILPAPLAAAAPSSAAILLGMTLVFHQEDG
ncbi:MAG: LptF/LptG family permease [Alphaproteobacteria bacterium]|nr:LptF/LptG family permease [Alphaproteobacteria bacterium]